MPEGENPKTWPKKMFEQIEIDSHGKPHLPQGAGFVNWSNSRGECILAYSKEREVGIDLEFYKKRNFEAISKRFFAPSEITNKAEIFYPHWTKKEAYYKCLGGNFFEILKSESCPNAKIWNLQGPYGEKHEIALAVECTQK
jgi:phosphopantetheinyl transferase